MPKYHDVNQQLVFLEAINKILDDDFIKMEIRTRKKGMSLSIKKYTKDMEVPEISDQQARELLWTYQQVNRLGSDNISNALRNTQILVETPEDSKILTDNLNEFLEEVGLPTIG